MSFSGRLFGSSHASCSGLAQNETQLRVQQGFTTSSQRVRSIFQHRLVEVSRRNSQASKQIVHAGGEDVWLPPTVADTKRKFYEAYSKPIPAVYNTVIQEFLVAQHLIRYNKKYQYDEVFALGFISIFDQVLEGTQSLSEEILQAYLGSLGEEASQYRADAEKLADWAKGLSGFSDVKPDPQGTEVQKLLSGIAERSKADKFLYSKFFAIGLFRLLELTGAKDPAALGSLVEAMNLRKDAVNRDLLTYKGVLSKLSAAKELMKEILDRDRKKAKEREEEKKALAEASKSAKEEEKSTETVTSDTKASV